MIEKMPFGRTGHSSSRVLFGGAAFWSVPQSDADRILELLLRYGVNHIDTAISYGDAELRIGPWMKRHRDDFFLATKIEERTRKKSGEQIRRSLERLQTDRVDLIQLHAVLQQSELEAVLGEGGALQAAVDARAEGLVRFIGITSHSLSAPEILLEALDRFDFSSVLLPCNYPLMQIPSYAADFHRLASICRERGVAMQTIKSICRRPWREGTEKTTATWYEPLSKLDDIRRAVGFVLDLPGTFVNSVGDIRLLESVLQAAQDRVAPASNEEMSAWASALEMEPLWPEEQQTH
jgi:aryl-alcohol dehydrogenase-like predicted oxidoreductase